MYFFALDTIRKVAILFFGVEQKSFRTLELPGSPVIRAGAKFVALLMCDVAISICAFSTLACRIFLLLTTVFLRFFISIIELSALDCEQEHTQTEDNQ